MNGAQFQWEEENVIGVRIADVKVGERARKDPGDLDGLMKSISELTLLQPIVVTRAGELIAGQRRLEACKRLGWAAIPAVVAEGITDAVDRLKAERDENTCRMDMRPSELVAIGRAIEEMERPKAEAAVRKGQEHGREAQRGEMVERTSTQDQRTCENSENRFRTSDAVGQALGISARNYERARALVQAAEHGDDRAAEQVRRMDETGSITPAYNRWKGRPQAPTGRPWSEPEPELKALGKNRASVEERAGRVRELAASGHNSRQIADILGYGNVVTFRNFVRTNGIEIPADAVINKARSIDSNRIVRETVHALEGLAMGVQLADLSDLETSQLPDWSASLTDSIRTLTRFTKQIKELTQ